MFLAYWAFTDFQHSVEYQTVLNYDMKEDGILIRSVDLVRVTDWYYDKKIGVDIKFPEEESVVCKWILGQIRDCERVRKPAIAACSKDYENHLEELCEKRNKLLGHD